MRVFRMSMRKFNWTRPYTIGEPVNINIGIFSLQLIVNTSFSFNVHSQNLLPDFISVTVPDEDDPDNSKCVIVEIINIPIVKPFIGGFVNKMTGKGGN